MLSKGLLSLPSFATFLLWPVSSFTLKVPFLKRQISNELQEIRALSDNSLFLEEDFSSKDKARQTQLWLDLRGTAVHPQAAIDYINQQLQEEDNPFSNDVVDFNLVDRALLSDQSFQNLLSSSDPYVHLSEVLYMNDDDVDSLALSRNGVSFPFGTFVKMPDDATVAVSDPIEAMESLSKGKWVVLFNEGDNSEEALRIDAIGNFLDIASTTACGDWETSELGSGLLLRTDDRYQSSENGGVAVVCSSPSAVVMLASELQRMQPGTSTSVTESGIIVRSSSVESSSTLPTALILPFDITLWKAAHLVYGLDESTWIEE